MFAFTKTLGITIDTACHGCGKQGQAVLAAAWMLVILHQLSAVS